MNFKAFALVANASALIAAAAAGAAPVYGSWGYDSTAMDASVKPGDDFWAYVNGSWAKRTPIAADRTFVGIDSVLNDQIDKDVRAIVEEAPGKAPQNVEDRGLLF